MLTKRGASCSGKTEGRAANGFAALLTSSAMLGILLQFVITATCMASEVRTDRDAMCLACHAMNMKKSLENGEELSLHVPAAEFKASVHGGFGCTSCHQDIAKRQHPATTAAIDNSRDYSVEKNQACRSCHAAKFKEYEGSIHASLVADGSRSAPLCSNCHSPHSVMAAAADAPLTGQPCKACHEEIFDAYAQSVHGEARASGNVIRPSHIQAPFCSDCHSTHDITAAAASDRIQSNCLSCHEGASQAHQDWLPNAALHLEVVACAACHSPMAERRIDLRMYSNVAESPAGQSENDVAFQQRVREIDTAGDGLDPLELWTLVRQSNQEGQSTDVTLHGRMEVSTGVAAHRLAAKTSAVRDCETCHQKGADTFQNVSISIAGPDGRKQRYRADSDVLTSVVSVASIGNFYMLGGTRISILDALLVLGIIAGLAIPLGHMGIGRYLKKYGSEEN